MTCGFLAPYEVVRVTRVDNCGRPVCGADNAYVDNCTASISFAPNISEGTDIEYRAPNGRLCAYKKGCPALLGIDTTVTFQSVSPEFIDITTGQDIVFGFDGTPIGWDDCDIKCDTGLALELWAPILGDDVCDVTGLSQGQWMYMLIPWLTNAVLGDLELASEAVSLSVSGSTRTGGGWGVGPYDVLEQDAALTPGPMLTPLGSTCHRRSFLTRVPPPTATCDYQDVTGGVCEVSPS